MAADSKHIALGDLMMFAATMIFGAMTIFSKQILAELEVFTLVALRFFRAFAACLAVFHKRYRRLDKDTFLHSGVLGTFLFVSYLCMVLGCKYTTASNA
ncbi:MAG: EamA family transporter, partial [Mogibacterium sp.]|nr:EamA family transporter [Mogibacterium sp.]